MTIRRIVIAPFLLALSFLTRIPANPGETSAESFPRSLAFFPIVGLMLGAVLCGAAWIFKDLPAPMLWASLLVALLAAITGALHLDGVADFFDALGGGRGDAKRMLDIMRDSRVGAHGATAICILLIAKVYAFSFGLVRFDPILWLLLPTISRAAVVPLIAFFPVVRPDGLAKTFHGSAAKGSFAFVALSLVAIACLISLHFVLSLLVALSVALVIGLWAKYRLGGLTGDVYGTSIECSEVAFIAAWIALDNELGTILVN
jgi:adenosylcobinamide-GDP ribazoletransferase